MTSNKSRVYHRRWKHFLLLIILSNTVQSQLNSFPLLRGTSKKLTIFCIIILLKGRNCVKIHVLWLYPLVLLDWVLQRTLTISTNYDITHVVYVGLVTVTIPFKLGVLSQKGSFVKRFLSSLTHHISDHLLLIIGDLNMSDLTKQNARAICCTFIVLLSMWI